VPAVDHLAELFEPVGGVTIKRMFGGLGVFKGGLMFALVADDVLYFKADEMTAPKFAAEGFGQWLYEGRGKSVAMPYWQAPERLYDEPDDFAEWARAAFDVAVRTQKKPKGGKKAGAAKKPARKVAAKKKPAARKK
jgi:DNA transformation protein